MTAWIVFNLFLAGMLALDLGVFHRKAHEVRMREALVWSAVWIAVALAFGAWVWQSRGAPAGLEFLTGYLIEKSLSVDNVFVFLLIFSYFKVPSEYRHKVLFWGVVGALALRAIFIFAGVAIIERFHWSIWIFGAILIVSGVKMWRQKDQEIHPERNPILGLFRRIVPVTERYEGDRFFVRRSGVLHATPLFVTLLIVETSDVIFAVDSIPAILAVTRDPFIVFTSNALALLGLRALFFALAGIMAAFHHLHHGLSAILVFVGLKMIAAGYVKVPTALSLGVIGGILAVSVAASLIRPKRAASTQVAAAPPRSG